MRLLLINSMLLFITFPLSSQVKDFDEVKIQFYPEIFSPGIGNCDHNENETRVRASICISIKQKSEIHEIARKLLDNNLQKSPHKVENFACQMVVDFIKSGKINRTIAISLMNEVRLDEDGSEYYRSSDSILAFFEKYLQFFWEE